jgi:WD40 repeat protein
MDADNKELRLYDLESGKLRHRLVTLQDVVHVPAFSPDGSRVLAMCIGGDVALWDVASGRELHHFMARCVGRIVFSPDGRFALGGLPDGDIQLWRLPE